MRRALPFVLLLASCISKVDASDESTATRTLPAPQSDSLMRIGGSVMGKRHVTATSDNYYFLPPSSTSGGYTAINDLRLIAWNAPVTLTCNADTVACWTQTATLTVSTTSNLIGILTDANGPDGPGACFLAPAGVPVTDMPMRQMFDSSTDIGYRAGVCDNQAAVKNNGRPCAIDNDCVTTTSGLCSTAVVGGQTAKQRQRGAYLMMQTPGGASYCFVSESQ